MPNKILSSMHLPSRSLAPTIQACVLVLGFLFACHLRAQDTAALLTIEGKVETSTTGAAGWNTAHTNQSLKVGDRVRTGVRSRATLRLSDQTVLRVNELTLLEIRPGLTGAKRSGLDLKSGSTYFFNRGQPSETDFRTPVASGAIRGTEFHLAVAEADGRTVLTLLDGEVALSNEQGKLALASGQQATVEPGQAPKQTAVLNVINVIQWCLYYPAILDVDEAGLSSAEKSALADSLSAYRSGDLLRALSLYPEARQPSSIAERLYHAALLLAVGQITQAESSLAAVPAVFSGVMQNILGGLLASYWRARSPSKSE